MKMENYNFSDKDCNLAGWKCQKIIEQVREFEATLDYDHEVGIRLPAAGASVLFHAAGISFQNPDLLYFNGTVDGCKAQLIQHISQINFLLVAIQKSDQSAPPRRIGFERPLEVAEKE